MLICNPESDKRRDRSTSSLDDMEFERTQACPAVPDSCPKVLDGELTVQPLTPKNSERAVVSPMLEIPDKLPRTERALRELLAKISANDLHRLKRIDKDIEQAVVKAWASALRGLSRR